MLFCLNITNKYNNFLIYSYSYNRHVNEISILILFKNLSVILIKRNFKFEINGSEIEILVKNKCIILSTKI